MSGLVRVGMSGFSYKEWKGSFYPEKIKPADMLAHYATRFGAVEINATFRRMPQATTLGRWRDAADADFRFALKAHQRITHWSKLQDVSDVVDDFVREARTLGERLGPVLFQTPPTLAFDREVVDSFLGRLPSVMPYAFEPRHASFFDGSGFRDLLARHRVALCLNDDLADPSSYEVTGPVAYFRFRREVYEPGETASRQGVVHALADGGTDVYVFFKHEDRPEAVEQALAFQESVRT